MNSKKNRIPIHNITRRDFLRTMGLGTTVAALSPFFKSCGKGKKVNILLIVVDELQRAQCGFLSNGKALTPNIDRLVKEGIYFDNAYSSAPLCAPARYSLFSGQYPSRATNRSFLLDSKKRGGQSYVFQNTKIQGHEINIARILKQNGFTTGIVGKTDGFVQETEFEKINKKWNPQAPKAARKLKKNQQIRIDFLKRCGFDYAASIYRGNISDLYSTSKNCIHNMEWVTKGALEFIEQYHGKPFFLVMCPTLLHSPDGYKSLLGDPRATEAGMLKEPIVGLQPSRQSVINRIKKAGLDPEQYAAPLWLDDGIGAVLRKLEDLGIGDNTLVVFTSDNGHENYAKGSLYQGGLKTITIMRWRDRIKPGKVEKRVVQNIDFPLTFLDAAGVSRPGEWRLDGSSLLPLFDGIAADWRESLYFELGHTRAILMGKYKYIAMRFPEGVNLERNSYKDPRLDRHLKKRIRRDFGLDVSTINSVVDRYGHLGNKIYQTRYETAGWLFHRESYFDPDQLYNIEDDPLETINLAKDPEYKDVFVKIKRELKRYLHGLPGSFGEFKKVNP